jgi:hypothetical protein
MHSPTGQVGGGAGDLFLRIFSAIDVLPVTEWIPENSVTQG